MNDLISRQAAIDAINQICPIDTECDGVLLDRVDVRCVLTDLPSAQPEPKKGHKMMPKLEAYKIQKFAKWISVNNPAYSPFGDSSAYHFICSDCEYIADKPTNYCPNCGARMNEKEKADV